MSCKKRVCAIAVILTGAIVLTTDTIAQSVKMSEFEPKYKVPRTISATKPDGKPVQLTASGDTDFIIMATWCPFSKQLKRFLNDPKTKPYARKRNLIFLFNKNEWPDVETELKDSKLSGAALEKKMRELR